MQRIRELNPEIPVTFSTMDASLSELNSQPRFRTVLLSLIAGLAVLLALLGIYWVMACNVAQKASEIGLRMALSASGSDVVRMVMSAGGKLAAAGLGLGLAAAAGAGRMMNSVLFQVQAHDLEIYAVVTAGTLASAALAIWVPARRAAAQDPANTLRRD